MFRENNRRRETAMCADAATASVDPIALQQGEGEALWFLGVLAIVKASRETTGGRVAVIEHLAPQGSGSPLHVHRNEDEWFYVTEGELTFWVGGEVIRAPAGSFVYGPRGIPHTFAVASEEARFLLVTEPAGFEAFMRDAGEPAQSLTLPPATLQPPDPARLAAAAAEYGIEILGPPGIPA
jgi:quercetin dioxygenase-like cupin family protein